MPWCPKCQMEYKNGFSVCADCNIPLVDQLKATEPYHSLASFEKEDAANKFMAFLSYSNIEDAALKLDEDQKLYVVRVPEHAFKQCQKLYQGFCLGSEEQDKKETAAVIRTEELDPESQKDLFSEEELLNETKKLRSSSSSVYIKKEDQFKDLNSSAWMFFIFGAALSLFLVLNILKAVHFLNGALPHVLVGILSLGLLYLGVNSLQRARKVKALIEEENLLTHKLNQWLQSNITEAYLEQIKDTSLSHEIDYFNQMEHIKEQIAAQFGEMEEAYLDQILDEFYDSRFGEKESV